jgi:ribokinase
VRVAVVGHHEWVEFARVDHVPQAGEIVHSLERWEEAAGGGAVAAVQLAKLGASVTFFTVFGSDELGRRARKQLAGQGVKLRAVVSPEEQRRAFTFIDSDGERTITVLGDKLRPSGGDSRLPWHELAGADAVYFVSGDEEALAHARRARVVVATAREMPMLRRAGLQLDAVVGSSEDSGERYEPGELEPAPHLVVATAGALGGWTRPGGPFRAAPVPGPIEDAYGCGDCFAAGLTFALGQGRGPEEALDLAARCGAAVLTGRGAYAGQLELERS